MAMWLSASRPSKTTSTAMPAWRKPAATVIASFAWSSTTSTLTTSPPCTYLVANQADWRAGLTTKDDRLTVAKKLLRYRRATAAAVHRHHEHSKQQTRGGARHRRARRGLRGWVQHHRAIRGTAPERRRPKQSRPRLRQLHAHPRRAQPAGCDVRRAARSAGDHPELRCRPELAAVQCCHERLQASGAPGGHRQRRASDHAG